MRRILAALAVFAALIALSGCESATDVTEYLSLPFSAEAKITIDSSEYLVSVEKGGADLVSVRVRFPEALSGLTVSLGDGSRAEFRGETITRGFPRSIAELIYDAFNEANRTEVFSDGDARIVRFASRRGVGSIRVDGFSATPLSIESGDVYIEFEDYQR